MSAIPDTELGEEGRLARVKAAASIILDEYLVCESSLDAAHFVQDLSAPQYHAALVKRLLTQAMDKNEADQEKAATLVSSLCVRGVVEESECEAGVELLLKSLPDLAIDVPKAVEYTAGFLSHFLEDKIVPEAILDSLETLSGGAMAHEIKTLVQKLLHLPLPVTKMKTQVRSVLDEYFVSGSLEGAIKDLSELEGKRPGQEVVKRTVVVALEKKSRHKEMASLLLSAMTRVYGSEQFFEGFIRVLKNIDDLALDTPDVVPMLARFIARAIVDDVLPPNFFEFVPARLSRDNDRVRGVADAVDKLLEKHSSTRLMNIWGAGAKSSVEELKESVKVLVDEFFVAGDMDEALDCVRDLDAPHFGHEVVKKIVYQAVERGDKDLRRGMLLLKALLDTRILDAHQLTLGMQRSVQGLADLSIDVPDAPERLRTLADWLAFEHLVSPALEQAVMLKAQERAANKAEVTEERVESFATFIVEEFLVCQSARDAAQSVCELNANGTMLALLVCKMLRVALDKPLDQRRMVAELLSSLVVRDAVEATTMEAGLEMLLKHMPDVIIDIPLVEDYVAPLIAHLLADGHVQESILQSMATLSGPQMGASIKGKVEQVIELPLPLTTMKHKVRTILEDYFVSGDLHSAVADLGELDGKRPGQEAVKRTLVMALEKKDSQKERASLLLSAMTRVYGSEQFFEGFIRVLKNIDDLALDTPDVVTVLAHFIARAIVDDVLPPGFIGFLPKRLLANSARVREVVGTVETLLDKAGRNKIVNGWGTGAKLSVEELKQAVKALVDEYFVEAELDEAVRCVLELDAPHFGHECVKRIVYQAVELGDKALPPCTLLLKTLVSRRAIGASQLTKGMVRAVLGLRDLSLDVPAASTSLLTLLKLMLEEKLISAEFKDKALEMSTAVGAPA